MQLWDTLYPGVGTREMELLRSGKIRPNFSGQSSIYLEKCENVPEVLYTSVHRNPMINEFPYHKRKEQYDVLKLIYDIKDTATGKWFRDKIPQDDLYAMSYLPSVMNDKAVILAVAKYFVKRPCYNDLTDAQKTDWAKAWEWARRHFRPAMQGAHVLGHKEFFDVDAKEGETFGVVTLDKSAGPFLNREYKNRGEYLRAHDFELEAHWDNIYHHAYDRDIWALNMKDELRSREKFVEFKTRAFTGSGMISGYYGCRLLFPMFSKANGKFPTIWSYVGSSDWKGGWNRAYDYLTSLDFEDVRPESLDGSNWDGNLIKDLFPWLTMVFWSYFHPEEKTHENWLRLCTHMYDCCNSLIVLPDGRIVMKNGGMPSGAFMTLVANTIINFFVCAFSFISEHPDFSYEDFMGGTRGLIMGDDQTVAAPHRLFNGEMIIKWSSLLGFKFTGAGEVDWNSVEFCSKRWTKCSCSDTCKLMLPLMNSEKFLGSLIWDKNPSITLAIEKITNMLPQMYGDYSAYCAFDLLAIELIDRAEKKYGFPPGSFQTQYKVEDEIARMWHGWETSS